MACELCELHPVTRWYADVADPFRFRIIDCDSCDVPMAVLGEHRSRVSDEESRILRDALARVADERYPDGWVFDDHMRQIPDHYHLHARPIPAWVRKLRDRSG